MAMDAGCLKKRDSLGEGVLAPGGEGVLVEVVDAGWVVVVWTACEGGPAGGIVDTGGDSV
jgi:hypothetical protein